MFQLHSEGKERVALAIYRAKPSPEEARRGKKSAFLTASDVEQPAFILTSGSLSPYYIDLRVLPSFPELSTMILTQLLCAIDTGIGIENFDYVLSTESAGISWGVPVARYFGKPFDYARKKVKDVGTGKTIEGYIEQGQKGVLVDDLVTTLGTTSNAIDGAMREGGSVIACIPIFDRMQYTDEELERLGTPLIPLINIFEFADIGERTRHLAEETASEVRQYHRDHPSYALNIVEVNSNFFRTHTRLPDITDFYVKMYEAEVKERQQRIGQVLELLRSYQ